MSEMVRNQGIIKKLSTPETSAEVYKTLDNDKKWDEVNENGVPTYIEDDRYEIVRGCIFDVSGAPDEYDSEQEVNEAVKISNTEYRVAAYYYNGGASFGDMLDESIPRADKEYIGLNDPTLQLKSVSDPVEKFNLFLRKWCGNNYAHLIDSDDNDGEIIRDMIRGLQK